jgi:dienelactone hydrolase
MKTLLLFLFCALTFAQDLTISTTTVTVEGRTNRPQPTLFVFAGTRADTLNPSQMYNDVGRILVDKKWLVVTLDLPCHGSDRREGEPDSLDGWRHRHNNGEDFIGAFNVKCSAVLDWLLANRYTKPAQVYVAGTSRGGFLAMHWACHDKRVKGVAAFAPVTTTLALSEYANSTFPLPVIPSMSLTNYAQKLSGVPVKMWFGPADERVGTQNALALVGAVQAQYLYADFDCRIQPAINHTVPHNAHEEAAEWFLKRIKIR